LGRTYDALLDGRHADSISSKINVAIILSITYDSFMGRICRTAEIEMSNVTGRVGTTCELITDGRDYFVARLDNGGVRVGMVVGNAFDIPEDHDAFEDCIVIRDEDAAERAFDRLMDRQS
jgi:hypothetical protein